MRLTSKIGIILTLANLVLGAQAETLEHLKQLWREGKYQEVIPLLQTYRDQPGGRNEQVDYFIATSECRVAGQENKGAAVLQYLLHNYRLSDQVRTAAEKELRLCQQSGPASRQEPAFSSAPVSGQIASGPLVSGKGGYEVSYTEIVANKVEIVPIAVADLEKRVFSASQAQAALQDVQKRTPGRVAIIDHFVLACGKSGKNCELPPEVTGECLVRYKKPLESQFDMKMPDGLVTVYLARELQDVKRYAQILHGVNLPLGTVAYSVYEDLSIVGMAALDACGSLAHELVHLAIRQNFGDSPAWLEEGLASEVAVAYPVPDRMQFTQSWRDNTLRRHWRLRPTVAQLLAADWASYAANDPTQVDQVAALQAMAAVFIRYLDAKQKLVPVYFALRNGRFTPEAAVMHSDPEILEAQMGMSLDQIDADFVRWFGFKPWDPPSPPL